MPANQDSRRLRCARKSGREESRRLDVGDETIRFGGVRESAEVGRGRERSAVDAVDEKVTTSNETTSSAETGGRSRLVRIVR